MVCGRIKVAAWWRATTGLAGMDQKHIGNSCRRDGNKHPVTPLGIAAAQRQQDESDYGNQFQRCGGRVRVFPLTPQIGPIVR
jgi:hypothetical protein